MRKRYVFNLRLKDESEVAAQTSSGRSFHIVGASKLKLLPNCFGDLWDVHRGTSRTIPSVIAATHAYNKNLT